MKDENIGITVCAYNKKMSDRKKKGLKCKIIMWKLKYYNVDMKISKNRKHKKSRN